jgi:tetratricopeptide (TPR) repeat protein
MSGIARGKEQNMSRDMSDAKSKREAVYPGTRYGPILLVGLVLLIVGPAAADSVAVLDPQLEKAVLAENWEAVIRLLPNEAEPNLAAPLRLIKGHACLATNRNKESLCLFLRASSAADLRQWEEWSEGFAARNPARPISHYFAGDAAARQHQWERAVADANVALGIDESHVLALNLRAVVFAHQGLLHRTRTDIERVLDITKGQLADAWANLGYYWIQRQEGAQGAVRAFDKAVDLSREFPLAFHGRGCVRLVLGQQEAKSDLAKAAEYGSCAADAMTTNCTQYALIYSIRAGGGDPKQLLAEIQSPGTTLNRRYGQNDLGASAANWFKAAEAGRNALGDMKWLPFNRRIGNAIDGFCSNRGAERLYSMNEKYGVGSVESWGRNNVNIAPKAYDSLTRIDSWSKTANALGGGLSGIGTGTIVSSMNRPGGITDNLMQAGIGGGLLGSGTAIQSSTNKWNASVPQLKSALQPTLNLNSIYLNGPGGVQIDFQEVRWDEGDWPFVALYGLAYWSNINKANEAHD